MSSSPKLSDDSMETSDLNATQSTLETSQENEEPREMDSGVFEDPDKTENAKDATGEVTETGPPTETSVEDHAEQTEVSGMEGKTDEGESKQDCQESQPPDTDTTEAAPTTGIDLYQSVKNEFNKNRKIIVKDVPPCTYDEVKDFLGGYGVSNISISKKSRTALVTLRDGAQAEDVIESVKGKQLLASEVEVILYPNEKLLCVSQLPFNLDEPDFKFLLAPYGVVERCFLMRNQQGLSKGYGFVEFVHNKEKTAEVKNLLDGKRLGSCTLHCDFVKEDVVHFTDLHSRCIYVDHLPPGFDKNEEFNNIFSVEIKPIYSQLGVRNGQPQGFGIVEYESSEDAQGAQSYANGHLINNHKIRVTFCIPGLSATEIYNRAVNSMSNSQLKHGLLPSPVTGVARGERGPGSSSGGGGGNSGGGVGGPGGGGGIGGAGGSAGQGVLPTPTNLANPLMLNLLSQNPQMLENFQQVLQKLQHQVVQNQQTGKPGLLGVAPNIPNPLMNPNLQIAILSVLLASQFQQQSQPGLLNNPMAQQMFMSNLQQQSLLGGAKPSLLGNPMIAQASVMLQNLLGKGEVPPGSGGAQQGRPKQQGDREPGQDQPEGQAGEQPDQGQSSGGGGGGGGGGNVGDGNGGGGNGGDNVGGGGGAGGSKPGQPLLPNPPLMGGGMNQNVNNALNNFTMFLTAIQNQNRNQGSMGPDQQQNQPKGGPPGNGGDGNKLGLLGDVPSTHKPGLLGTGPGSFGFNMGGRGNRGNQDQQQQQRGGNKGENSGGQGPNALAALMSNAANATGLLQSNPTANPLMALIIETQIRQQLQNLQAMNFMAKSGGQGLLDKPSTGQSDQSKGFGNWGGSAGGHQGRNTSYGGSAGSSQRGRGGLLGNPSNQWSNQSQDNRKGSLLGKSPNQGSWDQYGSRDQQASGYGVVSDGKQGDNAPQLQGSQDTGTGTGQEQYYTSSYKDGSDYNSKDGSKQGWQNQGQWGWDNDQWANQGYGDSSQWGNYQDGYGYGYGYGNYQGYGSDDSSQQGGYYSGWNQDNSGYYQNYGNQGNQGNQADSSAGNSSAGNSSAVTSSRGSGNNNSNTGSGGQNNSGGGGGGNQFDWSQYQQQYMQQYQMYTQQYMNQMMQMYQQQGSGGNYDSSRTDDNKTSSDDYGNNSNAAYSTNIGYSSGDNSKGATKGGYGQAAGKSGYGQASNNSSSGYGQATSGSGYGQASSSSGYGQASSGSGYSQSTGGSGYGQSTGGSGYGQSTGGSGYGQASSSSSYGQASSGSGYGQSTGGSGYGQSSSGSGSSYGQATSGSGSSYGQTTSSSGSSYGQTTSSSGSSYGQATSSSSTYSRTPGSTTGFKRSADGFLKPQSNTNASPHAPGINKAHLLPSPESSPDTSYIGQHSQGLGGHYADSYKKRRL